MGGETNINRATASSYPRHVAGPVGKKIRNIYEQRLRQFTDRGQYRKEGLIDKLHEATAPVKLSVYSPPDTTRPTFKEATSHEFKETNIGESFGPSWSTHWFKVQLTVPAELKDKKHLEFHWDANNEGLVWSEDGEPLQGLTGGGERVEWIFPDGFRDGKEHTFYVEMACNSMFGNPMGGDTIQPPDMNRYFRLDRAEIVAVNLEARGLYIDFWIIGDAAREFAQDSWEEHEAMQVCNEIMDCFIAEKGSNECLSNCRKIAQKYLGAKVDSADVYKDGPQPLVNGIGHCHIDTCWLWPWAETKRKIARSWSNQCNLLDRYPEHRFCASSAQQYKWLEMYYPALFDRVKVHVKNGTFQPIGGSWVEHDTNLPSGESLVRQFLYGQRFFESHFGSRSKTFWLPDTFGYSAQLPQLCRLAGMSSFFTQKLSWNNINKFPHTTFDWVALDGSKVICHMAPCETYTAEANFGDVVRSVTQHKSMDQDPSSLLVFGKGDGGGGPTWEHIEKLRRCRGMADTVGKLPRVGMGNSVDDFYARLEKKAAEGTKFVTWYGELYFELHRGTYTTQANNKRNNRKSEIMLHDIEYLATMASLKDFAGNERSKYQYPKKAIDEMWENVLLCQFHDCLPGSCIEMCYDDSDELYAKVFATGEELLNKALSALGFLWPTLASEQFVSINTLPWARSEVVQLPARGNETEYGITKGSVGLSTVEYLAQVSSTPASIKQLSDGVFKMSNEVFDVQVDNGVITSLYDKKACREVIPKGAKANQLVIFDDKPLYWQAWDVEVYHLDSRQELVPEKSTIIEQGPERVALEVETRISDSSWIKTTISLSATSPSSTSSSYMEMSSEVEWHEDKKFLKVEFPVDVLNTEASYETQFGIVRRPTHYNTTWDMAKFEVCCHKWADLSEAGYGVSILNDSKYGFATQGNVMRLSLLRAPKAPDAHADMKRHHIRYAIMPHIGSLDHTTVRTAYAFNNPMSNHHNGTGPKTPLFPYTDTHSYIMVHRNPEVVGALLGAIRMSPTSDPAIILDTIKRGEDDEDVVGDLLRYNPAGAVVTLPKRKGKSVILRLYDCLGGRCRGKVEFGGLDVKAVRKCNLLEDDGEEVEVVEGGFKVEMRPFEVVTFRLCL